MSTCFVICPIGEANSDIRRRSDLVLQYILSPVLSKLKYDTVRSDTIDQAGIITNQIIQHLIADDLVVADLTLHNPNVFYELAIRHATRKPAVLITDVSWKPPFDLSAARVIVFDTYDVAKHVEVQKQIEEQILAFQGDSSTVFSPVALAIEMTAIARSGSEIAKLIAPVMEQLQMLSGRVARLEHVPSPQFFPSVSVTPTPAGIQVSTALPTGQEEARKGAEAFMRVTGFRPRPTNEGKSDAQ